MGKYKYVLFDADNTIFDFDMCERTAFRLALEEAGITYSDFLYDTYHVTNDKCWKMLEKGEIGREELKVERFREAFEICGIPGDGYLSVSVRYEELLAEQIFEIDGVYEMLSRISSRYPVYVITNGLVKVQKGRFAKSRISEYIKKVYISEQVGYAKPDKRYFDRVLEDIGATPDECIVIGDSLTSDIDGAINSGIDSIWYNRRGADAEGRRPTYTVDNVTDAEEFL